MDERTAREMKSNRRNFIKGFGGLAAATAMGGCLVTHNVREFSHVEGLRIEDWT